MPHAHEEMLEAMRVPGTLAFHSALCAAVSATNSLEAHTDTPNPEAAAILAKLGNRLITASHQLGLPVQNI